jgi:hypothetical protein
MSARVVFLLSKDPSTTHGGDVAMSQLLMRLAGSRYDVHALCLSVEAGLSEEAGLPPFPGLTRVPKGSARSLTTVSASLRRRQSLVHARFNLDGFVAAIEAAEADIYVAEHSYMAEPFLRSKRARGPGRLFVNTHIPESLVWREQHGRLPGASFEEGRIRRDELRTARAAYALGAFDADEAAAYRAAGVPRAAWLALTLPPVEPLDITESPPRLVFLGDRTWPPNAVGASLARAWWPEISAGIDGAELIVVGKPGRNEPDQPAPGVAEHGFVDDLDTVLAGCRALIAPIRTGGGVRVKILDAAARGLPVVSTKEGVGSLTELLGITPYDDRDAFIARCRELLLDAPAAAAEGARLHAANADHWSRGGPQRTVDDWLSQ